MVLSSSSPTRSLEPAHAPDQDLVELRRWLHAHPELRFAEFGTAARLADWLAPYADELHTQVAGTGLVATVGGNEPGPTVLYRADMDAYPTSDRKQVPYASTDPYVAHVCGHDVHMTVACGLVRRLHEQPPRRGAVTVLFQPAEEVPFGAASGARAVLESGALAARYDAVLGLHCWPSLPVGSMGIDPVLSMAAKDAFRIVVKGTGAHLATPAAGRDSVLAISTLVTVLHAVIARRHDPDELAVINVGTIDGGRSQSLVAERAEVTGSLRTLDEGVRSRLKQVIIDVADGIGRQFDCAIELTWANEMPTVHNASSLVALAADVVTDVPLVRLPSPPLTTDDFALLGQLGPSLYLKLGVRGNQAEPGAPLHSGAFDVDERCIATGIDVMDQLIRAVLSEGSDPPAHRPERPCWGQRDPRSDQGPSGVMKGMR